MPSTKIPRTTIRTTTQPGSPGAGSGPAFVGGLTAHINDPVNAHPASAISYDGGPDWADGSTNPASEVESQLDKILTDLGQGTDGAKKITYDPTVGGTWANGNTITSTTVQGIADEIVGQLADNVAVDGAGRVGFSGYTSFGSFPAVPAGTLREAIENILEGAAHLSAGNGFSGTQIWDQNSSEVFRFDNVNDYYRIETAAAETQWNVGTNGSFKFVSSFGGTELFALDEATPNLDLNTALAVSGQITAEAAGTALDISAAGGSILFSTTTGGAGASTSIQIADAGSGTGGRSLILGGQKNASVSGFGGPIELTPGKEAAVGSYVGKVTEVYDSSIISSSQERVERFFSLTVEQPDAGGLTTFYTLTNAEIPDNTSGCITVEYFAFMGDNGAGTPGDAGGGYAKLAHTWYKKGGVLAGMGAQELIIPFRDDSVFGNAPSNPTLVVSGSSIIFRATAQDQALNGENNYIVVLYVKLAYAQFNLTTTDQ